MHTHAFIAVVKNLSGAFLICFLLGCSSDRKSDDKNHIEFVFDGLSGHVVVHLYQYDDLLFAATDQGLYIKAPAGQWLATGLVDKEVHDIAMLSADHFIASVRETDAEGIFSDQLVESLDGGESWHSVAHNFGAEDPETLYGLYYDAYNNALYATGVEALAMSLDEGRSWELLDGLWSGFGQPKRAINYNVATNDIWYGGQNAIEQLVLEREVFEPKVLKASAGRLMVLQVDGVRVVEKPQGGSCGGIEIKNVVLYSQNAPSDRWLMADVRTPAELEAAIRGLLQLAGITAQDTLVGLGDGAEWVENLLDMFCDVCITDVYHAAQYLEQVMQELLWSEEQRSSTRRDWCGGEIDLGSWLNEHLPDPTVWLAWKEESQNALRYLETRHERMRYPSFKEQGFPIGSGMIEGLNKSVVGTRMKRSGMQWSRAGAARMAALRAFITSKRPLVTFEMLRHRAFPPPSMESLLDQVA
jgi:hypothetical protein